MSSLLGVTILATDPLTHLLQPIRLEGNTCPPGALPGNAARRSNEMGTGCHFSASLPSWPSSYVLLLVQVAPVPGDLGP